MSVAQCIRPRQSLCEQFDCPRVLPPRMGDQPQIRRVARYFVEVFEEAAALH